MPADASTSTVGFDGPAQDAFAITPSDGAALTLYARALYVGGAGDVKVQTRKGTTVTFSAVPGGSILPVGVGQVFATGTTATLILGLL